jgi:hypothetical protein
LAFKIDEMLSEKKTMEEMYRRMYQDLEEKIHHLKELLGLEREQK